MTLLESCREIIARIDEGATVDEINYLIRQVEALGREAGVGRPVHFETHTVGNDRTVTLYLDEPKSEHSRAYAAAHYFREDNVWYPEVGSDRDWEGLIKSHLQKWLRFLKSYENGKVKALAPPPLVKRTKYDPKEAARAWKAWEKARNDGSYRSKRAFAEDYCEEFACNVKHLLGAIESGRKRAQKKAKR